MTISRSDGPRAKGNRAEPVQKTPPYALTAREIAVMRLVLEGRDPGAVADALALRAATVDRRLVSIRQKLSVRSTTEAALKAIKEHLLEDPLPGAQSA